MTNLVEVKVTENNKGIAVFNVDLGLTLTDVTIEYDVTLTESGSIIAMGLNRMTIKNQKGVFEFVSDGKHGFKGVGRGRKPNNIIDIAVTSLDVVETEMILGSFDTEIFVALSQSEVTEKVTSDTETVNTTETEVAEEVTEEVKTYNTTRTEECTQDTSQYFNTNEIDKLKPKILNTNTLDESVRILYNALVETRNDDLMENVFSLTELECMLECQGLTQDEIRQQLNPLTENSNTSYFIDVEGCEFRPITEMDLLNIIQKLHGLCSKYL